MIKIEVDNSVSYISGLTAQQFTELQDRMSCKELAFGLIHLTIKHIAAIYEKKDRVWFTDQKKIPRLVADKRYCPFPSLKAVKEVLSAKGYALARGYFIKKKPMLDKRGAFGTGLLYIVEHYLKEKRLKSVLNDNRRLPEPQIGLFSLSLSFPPYPTQIAASQAAKLHRRGIIAAPTGSGKSVIASLIINILQVPTLVVVPSLELKRQLRESFAAAFGPDSVGTLKDRRPIAVENVDALDPKKVITDYHCVLIDEFHHSGCATYLKLNKTAWSKIYYKLGLTATPYRSQDSERLLLESVLSKVIYKVTYQDAVANKQIVPFEAFFYRLPKIKMNEDDLRSWPAVYKRLIVENEYRNALIADQIRGLHASGKSVLCLVKEIRHGEILSDLTGAAFANGESDDSKELIQWFSAGKLKALIGTIGVVGEGVDTRAAEWVILASAGKSKNQFVQMAGRVSRRFGDKETGNIILFDDPNKWLHEHFEAQCRYLNEEYGIVPFRLPLPEEEAAA